VKNHGERDASHESIFNAQPSLDATRTGHWAPDVLRYDAEELKPALTELLEVAPSLRTAASYRYDVVDLTRQVLANDARRLLPLIRAAYEQKDLARFKTLTEEWMEEMKLEDDLLGTSDSFLLGRWLSFVPAWAADAEDRSRIEYDAHSILTTWGDRTASADLHEYGNRDWAGLVSSYYAPRWKLYFASLERALSEGGQPAEIDWYAFGDRWNRAETHFNAEPVGDSYRASLAIARLLKLAPREDQ
jgi:alpha-N-acetylglucosaminidase